MGTTYSRHNSGTDYGLSTADIYKIVRSEQYRQLDDSERLFFNDMIRQGDKYTSMMSAEEIVEDILYNIEQYLYDGELILAWFTDDVDLDISLLRRPLDRIILRSDQDYLLDYVDSSHHGINIQYID